MTRAASTLLASRIRQINLQSATRQFGALAGLVLGSSLLLDAPAVCAEALEEVIVTAQKRESNVMDVPVAVSVLSAEAMANQRIVDFADVARVSPSLTMDQASNTNNNTIRMRGIGTYSFSIAVEPSVSVVVDDVAVVRQAQAFSNLSDIERIEVLRGPQGTLFGKNASAGVVNIVTKAPSDVLTGSVELTATDDEEQKVSGSLSGPLGSSAGYRLNAYYVDRDGYLENLAGGPDFNDEEASGFRAKVRWDISDALEATLTGDYSQRDVLGSPGTFQELAPTARLFGAIPNPGSTFAVGITPGEDNQEVRLDTPYTSDDEQKSGNLKLNYQLGEHVLTSISSYQEWEYHFQEDVDNSDYDVIGALTGGAAHGGVAQSGPFDADQFTQEIRLTSAPSDTFQYLVGAFYADSSSSRAFSRGPVVLLASWEADAGVESAALFGQGTYRLTESTQIDAGIRFNHEKIDVEFADHRANAGAGATYQGDDDQNAVTGKVALQHFLEQGTMLFASVATGYKGQGYDVASGFNQYSADNPVGEETSISYEIGMKGMFLDDSVRVEMTAFLSDYDDYQAQSVVFVPDPISGTPVAQFRLNNVGELRTKGVETDLSWQASDALRLDASVAYVDAMIEEFPNAACFAGQTEAQGCVLLPGTARRVQDLGGEELSNSPDWKLNLGANYERELPGMPFNLFAQANYQWQDELVYDLFQSPLTEQDAYAVVNLSVGIVDNSSERYRVSLFLNNAFDENYASGLGDVSTLYGGAPVAVKQWSRNAQRYWGLTAKFGF